MPTIAELNDLQANPKVAYPEYDEVRAEASRRSRFVDPATVHRYQEIMTEHGADWCMRVLGHPVYGGLRSISCLASDMLMVAHERGLDPAEPAWLAEWRRESAETKRRQDEAREQARKLDADAWAAALATCGVPAGLLEVRPNDRSRQVRGGQRQALRHVVPLVDVRSARRRHRAGRELCAVSHARTLGEPADEPATCVLCVKYTAEIRPAE